MIKNTDYIFMLLLFLQIIPFSFATIIAVPPFNISKESILKILSLENLKIELPALYVFGDNFVDAGNNNDYSDDKTLTYFRNYTPYGIDFGGKPNGRYSNGRTVADFIAQIVGLPFPPPVLSFYKKNKTIPKTGLNYASGFTGIVAYPVPPKSFITSLKKQVKLFEKTIKELRTQFGSKDKLSTYLSKSLFFINSGTLEMDVEWRSWRHVFDEGHLTQLMVKHLSKYLQKLYQLGARKIVINNISPIGCQPHNVFRDACDDEANNRALLFNKHLSYLLKDLRSTLLGSNFVLVDLYKIFEDVYASPASYGFTNTTRSCCAYNNWLVNDYTAQCLKNVAPCKDRNAHIFFDPHNPTENMHFIWARRMLKDISISYPMNLIQLIQS